MSEYDVAVVGGGCIGLSTAKRLAEQSSISVCVVEKEHSLGEHQSGRNSGVLHPGFNYKPGSLKARFATKGTAQMKAYAEEHGIPLREFGVLVLACDDTEEARIETLQAQADANGVEAEILRSRDEIREHEPSAAGQAALYCPEAASIDSQQYVYALARDATEAGVDIYLDTEVTDVGLRGDGVELETTTGTLDARFMVNAAGLHADHLAAKLGVGGDYKIVPFRGEYYELTPQARSHCRTMIYPTPDPELPFLGVHFTRRTDDKVIVGPNAVLAFGREAYDNTDLNLRDLAETLGYRGFQRLMASPKMLKVAKDELGKSYVRSRFVEASRRLVPAVSEADFAPSYAGIRAQMVSSDGELVKQPLIESGPYSLHVLNAVSPGLTSSLPFGDELADRVLDRIDKD